MTAEKSEKKWDRKYTMLGVVLGIALILRVIFIIQLGNSELGKIFPLDTRFYRDLALSLSRGGDFPSGAITFNPLYPILLSLIFRVFGPAINAVRVIQLLMGLATIFIIYITGNNLEKINERDGKKIGPVGITAAVMATFYPHFMLYEVSLLATTVVTFLLVSSLALITTLYRRYQMWNARPTGFSVANNHSGNGEMASRRDYLTDIHVVLLGLCMGAGALSRPNFFFLIIPFVILWLIFICPRRWKGIKHAAIYILCTFLFLLPPIIYNASETGQFIPVTAHGGINFYVGNGPEAKPVFSPPKGMRPSMKGLIEDSRLEASQQLGRKVSVARASKYWYSETFEYISSNPVKWLKLVGMKLILFWNSLEVSDVVDIELYRTKCPVLKIASLSMAVISPLALVGLVILWGKRAGKLMVLFVGGAMLSVMLFYVNSRYRVPSVPVLILSASCSLWWAWGGIRGRKWIKLGLMVVSIIAMVVFVSGRKYYVVNRSSVYTNLGNYYGSHERLEEAEKAFARAYRMSPDDVETRINYAKILSKRGKNREAAEFYKSAFSDWPDYPMLAVMYGTSLEKTGETDRARELYRYAYSLSRDRDRLWACKLLARLSYAEGNRDEAVLWINRALKIEPDNPDLIKMLHRLSEP